VSADAEAAGAVFVYGTFLPGESRWPLLQPYAASWVEASAEGTLWDTGAGYPAAVFTAGAGGCIYGCVVRLRPELIDDAWRLLDAVEGEGRLYGRVRVETTAGPAFAYEWRGKTDRFRSLPAGWRGR
jgi:gamma-glutamylcyclotransferase (GGCT)/AIG2-like uncharacterized protein YtfP